MGAAEHDGARRFDVVLGERHDLLLLGDREPAGSRLPAAPALRRRHPAPLYRDVHHLSPESQHPLDAGFSGWHRLPPKVGGRECLGRQVVGQRCVANGAEEQPDERRQPFRDERFIVGLSWLTGQLTHPGQDLSGSGRNRRLLKGLSSR